MAAYRSDIGHSQLHPPNRLAVALLAMVHAGYVIGSIHIVLQILGRSWLLSCFLHIANLHFMRSCPREGMMSTRRSYEKISPQKRVVPVKTSVCAATSWTHANTHDPTKNINVAVSHHIIITFCAGHILCQL